MQKAWLAGLLLILVTTPVNCKEPFPQNEFLYGATVYPEFLTPDQRTRMLNEFQRAHFNVVRVGESSWGSLETAPGVYNFGWLREFLDELKASDPDVFAAVLAGLAKLRIRHYHREPLSYVGKLNTRVLWFFARNRRIVAVHGIRNKSQAIPARDLRVAQERMRDWHRRTER